MINQPARQPMDYNTWSADKETCGLHMDGRTREMTVNEKTLKQPFIQPFVSFIDQNGLNL